MKKKSRAKMVSSAAELMGSRGMSGTSFSDVLEHSGAPRGSIYHHFPGGKQELAKAAMAHTSAIVLEHQKACSAKTPKGVIEHFVALFRQLVESSCGRAGCSVAGVAVDSQADDEMMPIVRDTFKEWVDVLARQLRQAGMPPGRARSTAAATVAGVEGALIMCRAERTTQPLDEIERTLVRSLT
jgi:TetR/AcrR family transcriptional regulator, lmrAB and yxaGH operons repressor